MRLAIVNQYYPPDLAPTGRLAASLAEHRALLGDEVTIVTSSARYAEGLEPDSEVAERAPNVHVLRVGGTRLRANSIASRAWQYLRFYMGATRRLVTLPPQDVIVCLTTPPYIGLLTSLHKRRHRGTRIILWNMDCYPDILEATSLIRRGGLVARGLSLLTRRLMRRVDHLVCLDEAMQKLLRAKYAPAALPISVIPNWENAQQFPVDAQVAPWPGIEDLGLSDRFVVLYLGNAGYGHEFETVLAAAEQLRELPIVFLFVGGGSQHSQLRRVASEQGLSNVVLHRYVPEQDRPSVLAAADLGLVTLSDDALGLMCPSKLHSYLAMQLPVVYVGPRGSNVDSAIERFKCGLSIRHGQSDRLAEFIRSALEDEIHLGDLQDRARTAFDLAYCDNQTLPQFDKIIETFEERSRTAQANPCVATATAKS